MIQKCFVQTNGQPRARVRFTLPDRTWAGTIYLVGDFNNWDKTSHPLQRDRDGAWFIEVELDLGHAYQFRYLRDKTWLNDNQADAYVHNPYGTDNFVVVTDPAFHQYDGD